MNEETIAVVGLGYVGLPAAIALSRKWPTIGFDINKARIGQLQTGHDKTKEVSREELSATSMKLTSDPADLRPATIFIVAVPTPINAHNAPDLSTLTSAMELIGPYLGRGNVVVVESTVYPGVTEEICGPVLENVSGMRCGTDFFLGYSPERINPGDKVHRFDNVIKIVAGQDEATLERLATVYGSVIDAGVHRAPSIKVAEAAKALENTQRDLNIALMNELARIFDRIGIRTADVIEAAATKWNFLRFTPGLVGGHCIGVDPYYLTTKAEELGYQPRVILAGRRINDTLSVFIAQKTVKLLAEANGSNGNQSRVAILGLSFKENVSDLRNSKVPGIVTELNHFGINPLVHDPLVDAKEAWDEYQIRLAPWQELGRLDAIIYAVGHDYYTKKPVPELVDLVREDGVIVDIKSLLDPTSLPSKLQYWSL